MSVFFGPTQVMLFVLLLIGAAFYVGYTMGKKAGYDKKSKEDEESFGRFDDRQ